MTLNRAIAAFLAACVLPLTGAEAAVLRAAPDPCPTPAAAEMYEAPGGLQAGPDASAWIEESVDILRYVPLGAAGLYGRIALDPQTGLPYGADARSLADCETEAAARAPIDKARGDF